MKIQTYTRSNVVPHMRFGEFKPRRRQNKEFYEQEERADILALAKEFGEDLSESEIITNPFQTLRIQNPPSISRSKVGDHRKHRVRSEAHKANNRSAQQRRRDEMLNAKKEGKVQYDRSIVPTEDQINEALQGGRLIRTGKHKGEFSSAVPRNSVKGRNRIHALASRMRDLAAKKQLKSQGTAQN